MSRRVTVLLLEDVASLGKAGDIVTVTEGHARNFLFPEGKAALADRQIRTQAQAQQAQQVRATAQELEKLQALAERLEGTELTLTARVKEEESSEIFGSITARHIVEELNREGNLSLKPKDVKLTGAITHLGSQDVTIHLAPEIETQIRVTVIPNEET